MWLAGLLPPLFLISIITLALSGAEPPRQIRTLTHASPAEEKFNRRSLNLQKVGFSTTGLAFALSVLVGLQLLSV